MDMKNAPIWLNSPDHIVPQTRSLIESGRRDLHRLKVVLAQLSGTFKESLALIALRRTSPDLSHSAGVEAGMEDRNHLEQQLAQTERHLLKTAGLIAQQRELIEKLERNHPSLATTARDLLAQAEELHATLAAERVRLLQELDPEDPQ